jgi:hypothetical protein
VHGDVTRVEPARQVQSDALLRPSLTGHDDVGQRVTMSRDGSEQRRGTMAERRALAAGEHAREPPPFARELGVAERVDAGENAMQRAPGHAARDRVGAQAGRRELEAAQEPVLALGDLGQDGIDCGGWLTRFAICGE